MITNFLLIQCQVSVVQTSDMRVVLFSTRERKINFEELTNKLFCVKQTFPSQVMHAAQHLKWLRR